MLTVYYALTGLMQSKDKFNVVNEGVRVQVSGTKIAFRARRLRDQKGRAVEKVLGTNQQIWP